MITNALLEGSNRCALEKSGFLFGNRVTTSDELQEYRFFVTTKVVIKFLQVVIENIQ